MSIRKNTWNLDGHYDLTKDEQNTYSDPSELPDLPGPYSLWAFGYMNTGQLGLNDQVQRSSPIQVPGTQWSIVDGGANRTISIKSDNTLWAWGNGGSGELGQNTRIDYSSPIQVPGSQWRTVVHGQSCSFATKTDKTLWAWGTNGNGPLGLNDAVPRSSPVQVLGNQWARITADHGAGAVLATKTDGTLWAWGLNQNGKLGLNDTVYRSSPQQIPGTQWDFSTANKIHTGTDENTYAIKTDGTMYVWGENFYGALGQNNLTQYSSPVQIPGTQWNTVSAGNPALATKTDGTLWAWGNNVNGQIGQNSLVNYSSPVQIPGTDWVNAEVNNYFSVAIKTDGSLFAWGGINGIAFPNPWNQDNIPRSSPIQIPGTDWAALNKTLGHNHGFFLKTP